MGICKKGSEQKKENNIREMWKKRRNEGSGTEARKLMSQKRRYRKEFKEEEEARKVISKKRVHKEGGKRREEGGREARQERKETER